MCEMVNMAMQQAAYDTYWAKMRGVKEKREEYMCKKLDKISGMTSEQLLVLCGQKDAVPVDLEKILNTVGISAIPIDFSDIEEEIGEGNILGALISNGDNAAIFYNKKEEYMSSHRVRFTIAHELGHFCATGISDHVEFRMDSTKDDEIEKVANIFAGELLIPEHSLQKMIEKLILPTSSSLASIFDVSHNVMRARIKYLELENLVLE